MRIISKFHDYYDTAMGLGIDKTLIYDRKTTTIEDKRTHKILKTVFDEMPSSTHFDKIIVVFCGKIKVGYRHIKVINKNPYEELSSHHYSTESILKIKDIELPKESKYFNRYNIQMSETTLSRVFDTYNNSHLETDLNIKHKTPIIVAVKKDSRRDFEVVADEQLSQYNFEKLIDPYTAFQEISMYLGGVMGVSDKPMIEVSEKTKIIKHGFDKWSFRKLPTKRKK